MISAILINNNYMTSREIYIYMYFKYFKKPLKTFLKFANVLQKSSFNSQKHKHPIKAFVGYTAILIFCAEFDASRFVLQ